MNSMKSRLDLTQCFSSFHKFSDTYWGIENTEALKKDENTEMK